MNYLKTNEMTIDTTNKAKKIIDLAALFIGIGLLTGIVVTVVIYIINTPLIIA